MSTRKLNQQDLDSWVNGLIAKRRVVGVQTKEGRFIFGLLSKAENLRLDCDVILLPLYDASPPDRHRRLRCSDGVRAELANRSRPLPHEGAIQKDGFAFLGDGVENLGPRCAQVQKQDVRKLLAVRAFGEFGKEAVSNSLVTHEWIAEINDDCVTER